MAGLSLATHDYKHIIFATMQNLNSYLEPSWHNVLHDEFDKPYFRRLMEFVKLEYSENICFPPVTEIFSALNSCPFADVKVVIIGQDPYHGAGQAHGLCFSVRDGVPFPPSLRNVFKELSEDLGVPVPTSGNLEKWALQGVLLLNAVLSVREGAAGSHAGKDWEKFTDAILRALANHSNNIVFMLWGGYAKKKGAVCRNRNHLILESGHPSPLSANKGHWFGNRHFSKANNYLVSVGKLPIQW